MGKVAKNSEEMLTFTIELEVIDSSRVSFLVWKLRLMALTVKRHFPKYSRTPIYGIRRSAHFCLLNRGFPKIGFFI